MVLTCGLCGEVLFYGIKYVLVLIHVALTLSTLEGKGSSDYNRGYKDSLHLNDG